MNAQMPPDDAPPMPRAAASELETLRAHLRGHPESALARARIAEAEAVADLLEHEPYGVRVADAAFTEPVQVRAAQSDGLAWRRKELPSRR